jgi:hypothetical protein
MALARAAWFRGHRVTLLTNSPFAGTLPLQYELPSPSEVKVLDASGDEGEASARIRSHANEADVSVLVVDTFPCGLRGELSDLVPRFKGTKIWIHRDIHPDYVKEKNLHDFASVYDRLILPGESAPLEHLPHASMTAPWLIRNRNELLSREEALRFMGLKGTEPLPVTAVMGTGKPEEIRAASDLACLLRDELMGRCRVVFFSVWKEEISWNDPICFWPMLTLMEGIDVVVGSGGYNTVYEARATGTPLVALAQPRRFDRQGQRLRPDEEVMSPEAMVRRVKELVYYAALMQEVPSYVNGVSQAMAMIEASMQKEEEP